MVIKNDSPFTGFGGISEESVYSGGDYLSEPVREHSVFEPFNGPSLSGSFLIGGAFDGVTCAVWNCFVVFKKIVSERWVVPPWVIGEGVVGEGVMGDVGYPLQSPFFQP